jgi:hypothetical protein
MNEFNRQNQGRFAQEDQQFAQQMADQGVDENSEKYRYMKGQFDLNRGNQIQGAQNNAFQLGQGEQAQAYGQAANTYQMPLQQLQAVSPYYGYQNQNQMQQGMQGWQGAQNDLDRTQQSNLQQQGFQGQGQLASQQFQYNKWLQAHQKGGGGGGGGLSFDQQMALQNNSLDKNFYNSMVLYGIQNGQKVPQPGAGSGFAQGVAGGVTAGVVNGMVR